MPARPPLARVSFAAASFAFVIGLFAGAANAQSIGPSPNGLPEPAPVYMPFVWHGNALDQAVLDAQAQMSPRPGPAQRARHPHLRRR